MERLDEAVARVLAGLRAKLDGKAGGAVEAPPASGARRVMGGERALGELDHPRISSRTQPKRATGIDATRSIRR